MRARSLWAKAKSLVHGALVTWLIAAGLCGPSVVRAFDVTDVVDQVSLDSYTDYLENDLYAHDGNARHYGPEHDLARDNIQKRFEGFGLFTRLDPFVYHGTEYYNVVAVHPGVVRPGEIYIVGAHYDTVAGAPGACDNAAGVASIMESARVLSQYVFEATIVFIAFDREEQGMIGSAAYANKHAQDDIRSVIALDVIAYRPYSPTQPEYSQAGIYYQSVYPQFVDDLADAMALHGGLTCGIARNPGWLFSDYVPFDKVGLPAAVLTAHAGPVNFVIHTPSDSLDTPGYVDYEYGAETTRGLVGYLATWAGLEPVRMPPDFNGDWRVDIEDLTLLIEHWGQNDPSLDVAPPPLGDAVVDELDLEGLMHYWGQEIAEPGLLVHWRLDETDGNVASDGLRDRQALLQGDPLWQPEGGVLGGALELDGMDDYLSTALALNPNEHDLSVFAWVKGGVPGQVIFSTAGGADWLLAGTPNGTLTTQLKSASRSGRSLSSQAVVTDGDWHEVGLTWDGANRILYMDGVESARDTQPNLAARGNVLHIGVGKGLKPGSFWLGLIDEVRIYDRAVQP